MTEDCGGSNSKSTSKDDVGPQPLSPITPQALAEDLVEEFLIAELALDVDIAFPRWKLGIEYQGPSHYGASGKRTLVTAMKQRLLAYAGWEIVEVSYTEHERSVPTAAKDALVRWIIEQHLLRGLARPVLSVDLKRNSVVREEALRDGPSSF